LTVDIPIVLLTGPEVIAGSTRMKAASAQKMALATISSAVMVKLGHVHGNLMTDLSATNAKLRARAERITIALTGASSDEARQALEKADYRVKVAAIMLKRRCDAATALSVLEKARGVLRRALE